MRNFTKLFSVALLALLVGCSSFETFTFFSEDLPGATKTFTAPATSQKYQVYLPSSYEPRREKPFPVAIALGDGLGVNLKRLAEKHNFIVITPSLTSETFLGRPPAISKLQIDQQTIICALNEVLHRYNADSRNVLLTGYNKGGYALFWTGLRYPSKFRMVVGQNVRSSKEIFSKLDGKNISPRVPIYLVWGKDSNHLSDSWQAFEWIRTNGWKKRNSGKYELKGGHLIRGQAAWQIWTGKPVTDH